jgi:uncharacterized protein YndB with AHSA1/START domain
MANENSERTFVYVTYIATTPEKLWHALTSGEFTKQYFFNRRVESDWRVGSAVTFWIDDKEKDITGTVLRCDPPHLLSYTFVGQADTKPEPSRVTFELKPMGASVKLTLLHEGLRDEDFESDANKFRGVNNGWPVIVSNLKSVLETGKPAMAFGAPPRANDAPPAA